MVGVLWMMRLLLTQVLSRLQGFYHLQLHNRLMGLLLRELLVRPLRLLHLRWLRLHLLPVRRSRLILRTRRPSCERGGSHQPRVKL